MNEEILKCPKCGCNRFFVAVPGLTPEEELFECAYCKDIFEIETIRHKKGDQDV